MWTFTVLHQVWLHQRIAPNCGLILQRIVSTWYCCNTVAQEYWKYGLLLHQRSFAPETLVQSVGLATPYYCTRAWAGIAPYQKIAPEYRINVWVVAILLHLRIGSKCGLVLHVREVCNWRSLTFKMPHTISTGEPTGGFSRASISPQNHVKNTDTCL